jgi:glycosyltransferase involved in cell wall biosynthesis
MASSPLTCSFVLPAHNEEGNIARAVAAVTETADRLFAGHEVVVVNDGSSDRTAEIVRDLAAADPRVRLVEHPTNLGYGQALRTGFAAAQLDLVFLTDSDNQFDLTELEGFLPALDRADAVLGWRRNRQDPLVRRLSAEAWNRLMRLLFSVPVRDVDCAFKLMRRDALVALPLQARGAMVSTELIVHMHRSGHPIVEQPVTHLPRTTGDPSGGSPKVIARAFRELAQLYPSLRRAGRDHR